MTNLYNNIKNKLNNLNNNNLNEILDYYFSLKLEKEKINYIKNNIENKNIIKITQLNLKENIPYRFYNYNNPLDYVIDTVSNILVLIKYPKLLNSLDIFTTISLFTFYIINKSIFINEYEFIEDWSFDNFYFKEIYDYYKNTKLEKIEKDKYIDIIYLYLRDIIVNSLIYLEDNSMQLDILQITKDFYKIIHNLVNFDNNYIKYINLYLFNLVIRIFKLD